MRPSWDQYFMLMAKLVSTRSTCNSRPTGAVVVRDKRILCTGYNGAVPGAPHCIDEPNGPDGKPYCFRRLMKVPDADKYNYCRSNHAEANAIAQAARQGISLEGASIYCTLAPCYVCLKLLAATGIRKVFYEFEYGSNDAERDAFWQEAVRQCGIETFERIVVDADWIDMVASAMRYPTSERRLPPADFPAGIGGPEHPAD